MTKKVKKKVEQHTVLIKEIGKPKLGLFLNGKKLADVSPATLHTFETSKN